MWCIRNISLFERHIGSSNYTDPLEKNMVTKTEKMIIGRQ